MCVFQRQYATTCKNKMSDVNINFHDNQLWLGIKFKVFKMTGSRLFWFRMTLKIAFLVYSIVY